jgi:hypothetical protein
MGSKIVVATLTLENGVDRSQLLLACMNCQFDLDLWSKFGVFIHAATVIRLYRAMPMCYEGTSKTWNAQLDELYLTALLSVTETQSQ